MIAELDGGPVIDATDLGSGKSFNGFSMVNSSGSCGIRPAAIEGAN
jgi:hypothetical protein